MKSILTSCFQTILAGGALRSATRRGEDTAPYRGRPGNEDAPRKRHYRLLALGLPGLLVAISPLVGLSQGTESQDQDDGLPKQRSTGVYAQRLQSVVKGPGWSDPGRALLILSSNPDPKLQANLQEDLTVMRHILDKALDDLRGSYPRSRNALGVDLVFQPEANRLSTAYFEGYGALLLFNVNFPLLPAAPKAESPKEEKRASSEWEEARQEVFGDPSEAGLSDSRASEPYSEESVNRLKSSLLDGLKNASNIRDLQPDEGVTLCVLGGTRTFPAAVRTMGRSASPRAGDALVLSNQFNKAPPRRTVLTIRVKKGDIDAFARGQMNQDEFRKTARIAIYEVEAAANPWFSPFGTTGFGGAMFNSSK